MSQNDGKEPPIYVETLHNHRHHDYTATNGDAIHRFPIRLAEIWNQYDQIPNVPDPSLLLDGDSSGVTQLAKNRALVLVTGTTHKFELVAIPTDLALVITATQGQTAPIAGNLAPTLAAVPQPATGFTPVIQDSTGAVFEMQASVWVVDGLNHIVEFPYGVPPEMIPPFALTFVRYTGSTGGSSSAPVMASWAYVADATGTSFVADSTFPSATVSDWLVGEAAAAIAQSTEGAGSRTMFDVSKGAFRAGTVTGAQWDDVSRGVGSAAFGTDNTAATANSLVAGGSGLTLADQDSTFLTQRLRLAGGIQVPVNVVAVDTLATIDDYAFSVDTTGGAVAVTLPASPVPGQMYRIKYLLGGNAVTVAGNGNNVDQGDGTTGASLTLANPGDTVTVAWDDASSVWLAMDVASGGSTPVVPVPAVLDLNVSTAGDDSTGDGTVGSPYLTIQRALEDAQTLGWDDEATVTILASGGNFVLPTGEVSFNAGTRGAQRTPLKIRGSARTVLATGTLGFGTPPAYTTGRQLRVDAATAHLFAATDVGDVVVRFTSGTLSAYALNAAYPSTTEVSAYVSQQITTGVVDLMFNGGGTDPLPNIGDSVSVERFSTTVEMTGPLRIRSDANAIVFEDLIVVAHGTGGSAAFFAENTAIATNGVRFVPDAGVALSLSNPGAEWHAGGNEASLAAGFAAATLGVSVDLTAAGSSVVAETPGIELTNAAKHWSNVVVAKAPAQLADPFQIAGSLREFSWNDQAVEVNEGDRLVMRDGEALNGATDCVRVAGGSLDIADCRLEGSTNGVGVYRGGTLTMGAMSDLDALTNAINVRRGSSATANLGAISASFQFGSTSSVLARVVEGSSLTDTNASSTIGSLHTRAFEVVSGSVLTATALTITNSSAAGVVVSDAASLAVSSLTVQNAATGIDVSQNGRLAATGNVTVTGATTATMTVADASNVSVGGVLSLTSGGGGDGCTVSGASTVTVAGTLSATSATGVGLAVRGASTVNVTGAATATGSTGNNLEITDESSVHLGSATLSGSTGGSGGRVVGSTLDVGGQLTANGNAANGVEAVASTVTVAGAVTAGGNTADGAYVESSEVKFGGIAAEHLFDGNGGSGLAAVASNVTLSARVTCDNSGGAGLSIASGSKLNLVGDGVTPGAAISVDTAGSFGVLVDTGSALSLSGLAASAIEVANATGTSIQVQGGSSVHAESGDIDLQGGLADGIALDAGSRFAARTSNFTDLGSAGTSLIVDDGSQAQLALVVTAGTVRGCFVNASSSLVTTNLTVDSSGGEGCRVSRLGRLQCNDFSASSTGGNSLIVFQDSDAAILGTYTATLSGNNALNVLRNSSVSVHGAFTGTQATADAISVAENSSVFIRSAADVSNAGGNGVSVEGAVLRFDNDVTASSATSAGMTVTGASIVTVGGAYVANFAGTNGVLVSSARVVFEGDLSADSASADGMVIENDADVTVLGALVSSNNTQSGIVCTDSRLTARRVTTADNGAVGVELVRSSASFATADGAPHQFTGNPVGGLAFDASNVRFVGDSDVVTAGDAVALTGGTAMTVEGVGATVPLDLNNAGGFALRMSGGSSLDLSNVTAARCIQGDNSASGMSLDGGCRFTADAGEVSFDACTGAALVLDNKTEMFAPAGVRVSNAGQEGIVVTNGSSLVVAGFVAAESCSGVGVTVTDVSTMTVGGTLSAVAAGGALVVSRGSRFNIQDSFVALLCTANAILISGDSQCFFAVGIACSSTANNAVQVLNHSTLTCEGSIDAEATGVSPLSYQVDNGSSLVVDGDVRSSDGSAFDITDNSRMLVSGNIEVTGSSPAGTGLRVLESSFVRATRLTGAGVVNSGPGVQLSSGSRLQRGPGALDTLSGPGGQIGVGSNPVTTWAALSARTPAVLTDYTPGPGTSELCAVAYQI